MLEGIVTWAEIDLDAITGNTQAVKQHVGEVVEVIAVVKANAYGHGAIPVARAMLQAGASRLAVHRLIEGIELRQAGIAAPILIMGYTPPDGADLVLRWNLTPTTITSEFAQALSGRAAAAGRRVPVHVKVDTGMSRYGLLPDEVISYLNQLSYLPGVSLEGLFTHLATADSADTTHVLVQLETFEQTLAAARLAGFSPPLVHAANSAATLQHRRARFNAVRVGVALYGLQPSAEWEPPFVIHPALTLKSRLSRVRRLPAGTAIGYGRTHITTQPTTVGLVPVGYGDGYHRILSNQGRVLIGGQAAQILGRVSMDQFVVDVSHIVGASQDDEVVLIGVQGKAHLPAEEVASLAGTINYEITTALLPRVVRLYIQQGQVVEIQSLEV